MHFVNPLSQVEQSVIGLECVHGWHRYAAVALNDAEQEQIEHVRGRPAEIRMLGCTQLLVKGHKLVAEIRRVFRSHEEVDGADQQKHVEGDEAAHEIIGKPLER